MVTFYVPTRDRKTWERFKNLCSQRHVSVGVELMILVENFLEEREKERESKSPKSPVP